MGRTRSAEGALCTNLANGNLRIFHSKVQEGTTASALYAWGCGPNFTLRFSQDLHSELVKQSRASAINSFRTSMEKKFLLLMLVMLNSIAAWCADGDTFTAYVEVPKTSSWTIQVKMTIKIISESNKTCQIGDDTNRAIDGYPDLTKLELPDKVNNYKIVRIGDKAFAQGGLCDITTVILPSYVTSVGKRAFYTSNLESITFPSGFTTIGEEAFANSKIANINIPSTVTDIGDKAFASCLKLTSFTIPEGVFVLNNGLFSGCIKLSNIVWHNRVTSIGNSVFQGCTSLASISIPNSITTIGVGAFGNCSSLSSVSLFYGLTDIQSSAFSGCTSLNSITLPNSVTTLGSQAFSWCI